MRVSARGRALLVIVSATAAATVAGTGAFGVMRHGPPTVAAASARGARFAASPDQARVGHIPNTIRARSISTCPAGATTVRVALMLGTTTEASALVTTDANGRWTVAMSIPSNLTAGKYAVTAGCYTSTPSSSTPAAKSYNPQSFRVFVGFCPSGTTSTSTTAPCRVAPTTSTTM